jgi:hypothetical protein
VWRIRRGEAWAWAWAEHEHEHEHEHGNGDGNGGLFPSIMAAMTSASWAMGMGDACHDHGHVGSSQKYLVPPGCH